MLLVTSDELDRSKLDLIASASPDILVLDGNFSRKPFFNVRWDYAAAAYRLVCWLTQLGHRNFVYINEDFSPDKNLIVFSGFQRQILQMHLPLNPVQIVMDAGSDPHVWSHLPEIVRKNNISAIFCTSDRTAVQAADHLLQAGLRIPDDISIAALSVDEPPQHPVYQFTRVGFRSDMLAGSLPALMSAPVDRRELLVPITDVIPGNTTAAPKYDPSVKRLALALILKDHPTYRVVRAGFLNAVQHLGYQAEVVGISDTDEAAFRSVCLSLLDQNVDGVVMWLPQPDIIRKLSAAGIQVVCPTVSAQTVRPTVCAPTSPPRRSRSRATSSLSSQKSLPDGMASSPSPSRRTMRRKTPSPASLSASQDQVCRMLSSTPTCALPSIWKKTSSSSWTI